jgi:hypothetical protein
MGTTSAVLEPEVIPIRAKNTGVRCSSLHRNVERICLYGLYASPSTRTEFNVELSPRYCHEDWRVLRDAITCQKANVLALETASRDLVPIVWTGSTGEAWSTVPGCFLLEYDEADLPGIDVDFASMTSQEIDALVDNKCYMSMITDYECVRDGRARYSKRINGILDYVESWDSHVHFGSVPTQKELIRVAGLKKVKKGRPKLALPPVPLPKPNTLINPDQKLHADDLHPDKAAYVLIEFCCEPDSHLCDAKYSLYRGKTVVLIRLTEAVDMTTPQGLLMALEAIEPYVDKVPIYLWGSLPCTLGSTFQHINKLKSDKWGARKSFPWDQFTTLFDSFMKLAYVVYYSFGGDIIFEWPTGCSLWKEPRVIDMISSYKMVKLNVHGCMLGLVSIEGKPMKKPWTLYSTMDEIQQVFKNNLCDRSHEHQVIQGKNTSLTSSHPWGMTDKVHQAIQMRVDSHVRRHVDSLQESGKGEGSVACPPINVSASIFDVDERWIFDTGCAQDLVSMDKAKFLKDQFSIEKKQKFDTANGEFKTSEAVHLDIDLCGEVFSVMPYVMAVTPSVISVGKKVMKEDYCSIWIKGKDPCMITPGGSVVPLTCERGVPYIRSDDIQAVARDQNHDDYRKRCGVVVKNNRIVITVPVDVTNPAVPGPVKSEPNSEASAPAGAATGEGAHDHENVSTADEIGEMVSESEDSSDGESAEAQGTEDDDGMVSDESTSPPVKRCLWSVAESTEHRLSHKPALPYHCSDCMIAKAKRKRRISRQQSKTAKRIGDSVTCDHVFMKDWFDQKGIDGVPDVFNVMDLATRCRYSFPVHSKDTIDTYTALNSFKGRSKVKHIYSDNYGSIKQSVKLFGINWESSQPGVHHSNAIIERCNQDILVDTRVMLRQAGLPACFWPYAAPYSAHIHNITCDVDDGTSPWYLRFKEHFKGKSIPFGCGVWFLPAPTKYKNPKAFPARSLGIFLGYRLHPGGRWNGEYLVAELDDFINANLDVGASGTKFRISPHITERVDLGARGVCFPLRPAYERANETLVGRKDSAKVRKLASRDGTEFDEFGVARKCIFSTADSVAVRNAEEEPSDQAEPSATVGAGSDEGIVAAEPSASEGAGSASSSSDNRTPARNWYVDASGRRYPADHRGDKIMKSNRPAHLSSTDWFGMSAAAKSAVVEAERKRLEEERSVAAPAISVDDDDDPWRRIRAAIRRIEDSIDDIAGGNGEPGAPAISKKTNPNKNKRSETLSYANPPMMPCKEPDKSHRMKRPPSHFGIPACVARPVSKSEIAKNPTLKSGSCRDALDKEWKRLREKKVWDEGSVKNWKEAIHHARNTKNSIHLGRMFGIMVEKNHELKVDDPARQFKYRVVFQGNNVFDQDYESAIFQDLGSSPASMEASRNIDCYGCFPGHGIQQADAEQAYIQAELKGTETWVSIPEEAWPDSWWKTVNGERVPAYDRPVCKLLRALYGHPDSGTMWDKHCHKRLLNNGFVPITSWPSCYFNSSLSLMLTVYVDDFKLAGPKENLTRGWELVTGGLDVDEPEEINLYLGCKHERGTKIINGRTVVSMTYNMEDYFTAIFDDYEKLASQVMGKSVKLKEVATPFLEDDHRYSPARVACEVDPSTPTCPWCHIPVTTTAKDVQNINSKTYMRTDLVDYKKKAGSQTSGAPEGAVDSFSRSSAPGGAEDITCDNSVACAAPPAKGSLKCNSTGKVLKSKIKNNIEDLQERGQLQPLASSILMRLLYGARYSRFDLLKAISRLAGSVAYWSVDCDRRLMRLPSYVKGSLKKRLVGFVGNTPSEVMPHQYADADFAGDPRTLRSTSGAQIQIEGSHTRFPIIARSIRQAAVANSTPDAELAALAMAFRSMAIPMLDLWEVLLPVHVECYVHEDTSACISVVCTGKNPTMTYIGRTQGINIQLLHEFLGTVNPDCPCSLVKTESADMVADIHTKGFTKADEWRHVCRNANMFYAQDFVEALAKHSEYFDKQKGTAASNIGERPPIIHDVHEYLLGSRPDGEFCTSFQETAEPSAVACPCIEMDTDDDDPVAKNLKDLKQTCLFCHKDWVPLPDQASLSNTCPQCIRDGVENPLPRPPESSASVGAGSDPKPSATVGAGSGKRKDYNAKARVVLTSDVIHSQFEQYVPQHLGVKMGPAAEQLRRVKRLRADISAKAIDERGEEDWYTMNPFKSSLKYDKYSFPWSAKYKPTSAYNRSKTLPDKCKVVLMRTLEILEHSTHNPNPFTSWAGVAPYAIYQRLVNTMRTEGMYIPEQLEAIAILATHEDRRLSVPVDASTGTLSDTDKEVAERKSKLCDEVDRWMRSHAAQALDKYVDELLRTSLDSDQVVSINTLVITDSCGINHGPEGGGDNRRPYTWNVCKPFEFNKAYARIPIKGCGDGSMSPNGVSDPKWFVDPNGSKIEVVCLSGPSITVMSRGIKDYKDRMMKQGIDHYEVRIIDNRTGALSPKDNGHELLDWPQLEKFAEECCGWLLFLKRKLWSLTYQMQDIDPAHFEGEHNSEKVAWLDQKIKECCINHGITRVSTKSLYTKLDPWRVDAYHFGWDINKSKTPAYFFHINDIMCAEWNRLTQFATHDNLAYFPEAKPKDNFRPVPIDEFDNLSSAANCEYADVMPIVKQSIQACYSKPKPVVATITTLPMVEMLNNRPVLIYKRDMDFVVSPSRSKEGAPTVYASLKIRSMYAVSETTKDVPFTEAKLSKFTNLPEDSHITLGYFPARYRESLEFVIQHWLKSTSSDGGHHAIEQKRKGENLKGTYAPSKYPLSRTVGSSASVGADSSGPSVPVDADPKATAEGVLVALLRVNGQCPPNPEDTTTKGNGQYILDCKQVDMDANELRDMLIVDSEMMGEHSHCFHLMN